MHCSMKPLKFQRIRTLFNIKVLWKDGGALWDWKIIGMHYGKARFIQYYGLADWSMSIAEKT